MVFFFFTGVQCAFDVVNMTKTVTGISRCGWNNGNVCMGLL